MKDILERLLSRATHTFIIQGNPNLYYDAAHEIERLRAENEKLRKALKPFAHNYQNNGLSYSTFMFAMKDLLAAKKALGDTDE